MYANDMVSKQRRPKTAVANSSTEHIGSRSSNFVVKHRAESSLSPGGRIAFSKKKFISHTPNKT